MWVACTWHDVKTWTSLHFITGWAVQEKSKRGFLEDGRIALELATTAVFDAVRWLVRKVLLMPDKPVHTPMAKDRRRQPWADSNEVRTHAPPECGVHFHGL